MQHETATAENLILKKSKDPSWNQLKRTKGKRQLNSRVKNHIGTFRRATYFPMECCYPFNQKIQKKFCTPPGELKSVPGNSLRDVTNGTLTCLWYIELQLQRKKYFRTGYAIFRALEIRPYMPLISSCEFLSGWVSGIVGIMTGHPLDTVKVRQQISKDKSLSGNLHATYKYEGVRGFYKGMFFPTLSAGALNALFFGVYGNSLRQMIHGSDRTLCCEDSEPEVASYSSISWHCRVALAGFLGGAAGVLVGCPVDCIKTKLQGNRKDHLSPWTVSMNIVKQRGIKGLYCGFLPMICRDGPGFATYIVTYEHVLCTLEGKLPLGGQHRLFSEILSGGMAGSISWIAGMPFDVVKSRIQADDPFRPKYSSMIDCFQKSYRTGGLQIFFNGMSTAIIRSFPVNAVTFVVYQFCMNKCHNFNLPK